MGNDVFAEREKDERYSTLIENIDAHYSTWRFTSLLEKFSSVLSLDIQNVTNRNNIFNIDYEYNRFTNTITKEEEFQLGLIPVLNYRLEF